MRQVCTFPAQRGRYPVFLTAGNRRNSENTCNCRQIAAAGCFIEGNLYACIIVEEVVAGGFSPGAYLADFAAVSLDTYGVKKLRVCHLVSTPRQYTCHRRRVLVHVCGNPPDTVRTVIHGVHGCHVGQQCLCRADVGGRFLPADMLFAGLQAPCAGPSCPACQCSCR